MSDTERIRRAVELLLPLKIPTNQPLSRVHCAVAMLCSAYMKQQEREAAPETPQREERP